MEKHRFEKIYTLDTLSKIIFGILCIIGGAAAAGSLLYMFSFIRSGVAFYLIYNPTGLVIFLLSFFVFILSFRLLTRARLTIDSDQVTARGPFFTRRFSLADYSSYKVSHSKSMLLVRLIPLPAREIRPLTFIYWYADEQDFFDTIYYRLASASRAEEPDAGADEAEVVDTRMNDTERRASYLVLARVLTITILAISLVWYLAPPPVSDAMGFFLVIYPFITMFIVLLSQGMLAISRGPKNKHCPSVILGVMLPALVPLIITHRVFNMVFNQFFWHGMRPLLPILAVLYLFFLFLIFRREKAAPRYYVSGIALSALYAYNAYYLLRFLLMFIIE